MRFSNYHTHTRYCDGADSPEELVREALRLGCPELGFSGHSHSPADECGMTPENTRAYTREIRQLQTRYGEQINIRLGIEQDYFSDMPTDDYDYVIGSVHAVEKNGRYLSVDKSLEDQIQTVQDYYDGDFYAFVEDYYALVAKVFDKTHCHIIGHFDLVTKFNEGERLFETGHPRYRDAAMAALEHLATKPVIFEINTGAISRGYRKTAYPADFLLRELEARGAPLLLSSDCHKKQDLLLGFDRYWGCARGIMEKLEISF